MRCCEVRLVSSHGWYLVRSTVLGIVDVVQCRDVFKTLQITVCEVFKWKRSSGCEYVYVLHNKFTVVEVEEVIDGLKVIEHAGTEAVAIGLWVTAHF